MDEPIIMTVVFIGGGLFSILGAVSNWDWFFDDGAAKPIVQLFGREGARAFYILIGIFCVVAGCVAATLV